LYPIISTGSKEALIAAKEEMEQEGTGPLTRSESGKRIKKNRK
jgi:hypothetical protein